jgi:hypothetical protein
VLLLLATLTASDAGAWTREWGEVYVRGGVDGYVSNRFENALQDVEEVVSFRSTAGAVYAEIGLSPAWPVQLTLQVPVSTSVLTFRVEDAIDPDELGRATTTRLGDAFFSLQTALYKKKVRLSGQLEFKLPLYRLDSIGVGQGAWTDVFPRPGDGQLDIAPWLWVGGGFPHGFYEVGVGYRFRTEAFFGEAPDATLVDGMPFHGKIGGNFWRIWVIGEVIGIKNFRDDLFTREWVAVGATVMVNLWDGLYLDGRVAPEVWTRKASQGIAWSAGLSWKQNPPQRQ